MKLSKVTIGLLFLGASLAVGQEGKKNSIAPSATKSAQSKIRDKNARNEEGKEKKVKNPDSNATKTREDSLKVQPKKISPHYCPPCGMG